MKYRLLWASQLALHDTSAGAALQWLTMLRYLMRLYGSELEIRVLCAACCEHERGRPGLAALLRDVSSEPNGVRRFEEQHIAFTYAPCASSDPAAYTERDGRLLYSEYIHHLCDFRPDAVIGYGGELVSCLLRHDAAQRCLSVIYCLSNVSHQHYAFPGCQAVLTDSQATAEHYARNFGINVTPVGTFIEPERVLAPPGSARGPYITMVNPVSYKGVAILARLAELALREAPQLRFQVVEGRGRFADELGKLYEDGPGGQPRYPFRRGKLSNVRVLQHTRDMGSVYAQTAVLLAPSLCLESWGRVASEALLNGIPVLCSSLGGLPEAAGVQEGAGVALDVPPACRADFQRLPTPDEVRPWLEQAQRLCDADCQAACAAAAARQTPEQSAERAWEVLLPLLRRRAGQRAQLPRSGDNTGDALVLRRRPSPHVPQPAAKQVRRRIGR